MNINDFTRILNSDTNHVFSIFGFNIFYNSLSDNTFDMVILFKGKILDRIKKIKVVSKVDANIRFRIEFIDLKCNELAYEGNEKFFNECVTPGDFD